MWPGVEPGKQGDYNMTYLQELDKIVSNLANENIEVILDFHQDLFHRKYCGEGVADYVYDICHKNYPASSRPFPLPVGNETLPIDSNGDPTIEACLSKSFFKYYLAQESSYGFQCLYDNVDGLWDAFAGYWTTVVTYFKDRTNVIGYELINEPWVGDYFDKPKRFLPGYTELNSLQPMYQYLNSKIRLVDNNKIIFYEGLTIDYFPNGFTSGPGSIEYSNRQALSYHIYCPVQPSLKLEIGCDIVNDEFLAMRKNDVKRLGGGMIMTEFGATKNDKFDLYSLEKNCQQADKHIQSWIYWQYKYYNDITTSTPGESGESLYYNNGTVVIEKLKVLSRTYPQIIAGSNLNYHFNPITSKFTMSFHPLEVINGLNVLNTQSIIYFNRELYYNHGIQVTFESQEDEKLFNVSCYLEDAFLLTQISPVASDKVITITATPCELRDQSHCPCN